MRAKWDRTLRARYAAICVHEGFKNDLSDLLINSFLHLYGLVTLSLSGLKIVEVGERYVVIRIWNKYLPHLRASVLMLRRGDKPIQAHVLIISGTLKALRKKLSRAIGP